MLEIVCRDQAQSKWLSKNLQFIETLPCGNISYAIFRDGSRSKPFKGSRVDLDDLLGIKPEPEKGRRAGPSEEVMNSWKHY